MTENEPIRQVISYKYLGLFIDDKISWEVHVDYLFNLLFMEAQTFWGYTEGYVNVLSCLYCVCFVVWQNGLVW